MLRDVWDHRDDFVFGAAISVEVKDGFICRKVGGGEDETGERFAVTVFELYVVADYCEVVYEALFGAV